MTDALASTGFAHRLRAMARSKSRQSAGAPALERTVADLRALAHPLRLRMMELFAESPKTTKQVADILGQPPTRLYHHVAALKRAGLLIVTAKRQNRGAVEKWYAGVTQQIGAAQTRGKGKGKAEGRSARRAVAATVLEQAKQEVMSIPFSAKQAALLARIVVAVPPSKIPRIRKRLFEAVQALRTDFSQSASRDVALGAAKGPNADCERWAVTLAFAPVKSPSPSRKPH